jgi:hypothetical protein
MFLPLYTKVTNQIMASIFSIPVVSISPLYDIDDEALK